MIKLDIISDPICPWCYIGKTYLDRALEARPNHAFEIEWHPFQLNPDMPADGMDRVDYLERKFGGQSGAAQAYAPIVERAEQLKLGIDFAAIERTPNTLDAHRLIHWAGLEGRQTAMVSRLFKAYFNEGRDIGHAAVLSRLAGEIGMDREMVDRLLASPSDRNDIRARDQNARDKGVTGVPCFIIANQHALSGAQGTDLWLQVIDELAEQIEAVADPAP
ncbi:DsbA family oxidoreductase [Tropicimonas sp. S265A]|uniref:DsbA family oxidoreductase n=1 Tax=Tropicimonas sp. S265A TaxID=3415134 RepID=UPI003C7AC68A